MTPRKPRKMPKNQRAYPKKGKPRLVEIIDENERSSLVAAAATIGVPHVYRRLDNNSIYVEADDLRKWRALRNPPTSSVEQA